MYHVVTAAVDSQAKKLLVVVGCTYVQQGVWRFFLPLVRFLLLRRLRGG